MEIFNDKKIVIKIQDNSIAVYDDISKDRIDFIPRDGNEINKVLEVVQELLEQ